jgi:hypothetical protein
MLYTIATSLRLSAHQGNWQKQRNRDFRELLSARVEHMILNGGAQIEETATRRVKRLRNSSSKQHKGNWQPQRNRNFRELLLACVEHMLLNGAAQIEETATPLRLSVSLCLRPNPKLL